jgi:HSP20 family molecular chaperone IbpA
MPTKKKRSALEIIREYFESMERVTEQLEVASMERPSWNQKNGTMEPLRNVLVAPREVIVTVDLPYTQENSVQVKPVDRDTIEVSSKMRRTVRFDDFGMTHYRGEFQILHCHTRIPVPVRMHDMEIRFKKGILEVRLPRRRERRSSTRQQKKPQRWV